MAIFSSTLLDIAADNIPKTSPFPKRKAKPWFDEDCQAAKKERSKANRLANKHLSAANSMRARLIQARTKKLFKQKKSDSWKNYISSVNVPPKVLLLCRSWGACVPRRSQRLCRLEFWLLVGTTMLDRLWARGQTKCNTLLMLATSVFGRIHKRPCYVMAQPKSRLDIPWPNNAECMGHVWYHFSCWYPLLFDVESLAGCVGG